MGEDSVWSTGENGRHQSCGVRQRPVTNGIDLDVKMMQRAGLDPVTYRASAQASAFELSESDEAVLALRHRGDCLTEREREIAHLLLRGHSVKSSARVLEISPETVRMHRKNLYTKLEISSQAELFALFIDWLTA